MAPPTPETKTGTSALALRIQRGGLAVRGFEVQHIKRLHVIVARRDLRGYAHLHRRLSADGTWTDEVTLAHPAPYRVFADFRVEGESHVLGADLTVPGEYRAPKRPAASTSGQRRRAATRLRRAR